MELVILLVVLAGIAVGVGAYFLTRPKRGLPLEPPVTRTSVERPPVRDLPGVVVEERARPTKEPVGEPAPARVPEPEPIPEPIPEPTEVEPASIEAEAPAPRVRVRFLDRITKTRQLLGGYLGTILGRSAIDDETWDDLEEALLRADVGVSTTQSLLGDLKGRVKAEGVTEPAALLDLLKTDLKKRLAPG